MNFKVLLVDDDAIILVLHKIVVERSKLPPQPESFKSAKETLEFIKRTKNDETAFLILLDLNMPGMNGWEFLEEIKLNFSQEKIFVAIVSSSVISADIKKSKEYKNVIDYIDKPLDIEKCNQLYLKMQQLLSGSE